MVAELWLIGCSFTMVGGGWAKLLLVLKAGHQSGRGFEVFDEVRW